MDCKTIEINGVKFVRPDMAMAKKVRGMQYCIVRTYSAGVFAGYMEHREGKEVMLLKARRLWKWYGAASLSQLAVEGTSRPGDCKFPCEMSSVLLTEAIEIIPCTEIARNSIGEVAIWKE